MRRWRLSLPVGFAAALLAFDAQSFDWPGVALKFLQRHAVPCAAVAKMDSVLGADIATCEDGREWALFWVENEVAFIDARTRRFYRWQADLYRSHPQLYESVTASFQVSGDGFP